MQTNIQTLSLAWFTFSAFMFGTKRQIAEVTSGRSYLSGFLFFAVSLCKTVTKLCDIEFRFFFVEMLMQIELCSEIPFKTIWCKS